MRTPISFLSVVLPLLLLGFYLQRSSPATPIAEKMVDRTFNVETGGLLDIRVGDADLNIRTGNQQTARVEIWVEGRDADQAKAYFERQRFSVAQHGNTIEVLTDPQQMRSWAWNRTGNIRIWVDIQVPQTFNAEVQSSDGDISLATLNGRAMLRTSDGDITVENITGTQVMLRTSDGDIVTNRLDADDIQVITSDGDLTLADLKGQDILLRSSDGDITAASITGNVEVRTSDGNLDVGRVHGRTVRLQTSDGDIRAEALLGERLDAQTSDGSIDIDLAEGELRAVTSSGSVRVHLAGKHSAYIRSSDGDITITAPSNLAADLRLRGNDVRVSSNFDFSGQVSEERADGRIRGGGPRIEARTSDGTVTLRPR